MGYGSLGVLTHDVDAVFDFTFFTLFDLRGGPFGRAEVGPLEPGEVIQEGEEPGEGTEGCEVLGTFLEEGYCPGVDWLVWCC